MEGLQKVRKINPKTVYPFNSGRFSPHSGRLKLSNLFDEESMTSARSHMGITGERTDEFRRRDPLDVSEMSNAQLGTAILSASNLFAKNSRHAAILEEAAERLLRRR